MRDEEGKMNQQRIELSGKTFEMDKETAVVLASLLPDAATSNDYTAVLAVIELGKATGRVEETGAC